MKYELAKYEIKKHKIINAAFKRIYEQGIEGTTMRSIAKEAKVNQALLHYYFKDKEHLLEEFSRSCLTDLSTISKSGTKILIPHRKKLEAYFAAGKDFLEKQRELFVVMIDVWAYCFRSKKLQKDYAGLNRRLTGVMREHCSRGKAKRGF